MDVFDYYEKAPTSLYVECADTPEEDKQWLVYDGGWWRNCTNGTRF